MVEELWTPQDEPRGDSRWGHREEEMTDKRQGQGDIDRFRERGRQRHREGKGNEKHGDRGVREGGEGQGERREKTK